MATAGWRDASVKPIEYEGDKSKVYSGAGRGETFEQVLARRLSRRGLVKSAAAVAAVAVTGPRLVPVGVAAQTASPGASPAASPAASPVGTPAATTVGALGFEPITLTTGETPVVATGHRVRAFLRWGDPLVAGLPEFDPTNQSAAEQAQRFGYNCDWIAFMPLPPGSDSTDHGLLVVNHEYTNPELMFPGYQTANPDYQPPAADDAPPDVPEFLTNPTQEIVDVELEAHGLSVVEVRRNDAGEWETVLDSRYNRRITGTTPMEITGPAAGADLMRTSEDDSGARVVGTLNNCAGGVTPWGTIVSGEENFQQYFANLAQLGEDHPAYASHARFGIPEESSERRWEEFYGRFDLTQEPNEPFRFGWGVEFDPYDPTSTPKKRTTMGRNKHEGHTSAVAPDGRVAIYTGDDERFEYAYKFVTANPYDPDDRAANTDLLDEGVLYVAKFNDDGSGDWLPLVHGEGGLTEANGFASQADVLVNTRFAADALGATKMDRPEDFETNPVTGKVYLVCTNNNQRTLEQTDEANPRTENVHGHIIEITEDANDHAGTTFTWQMFLLAGDPAQGSTWFAGFDTEAVSPISSPDNIAFDVDGNLWISTDGLANNLEGNDGLFVAPTEGENRGQVQQFFSAVVGAEVSGPVFNPDNSALFASVQHPAEGSSYQEPATRWPDGGGMPPRPSVVLIQTDDGVGRVGSGLTRA
jgi:secreted PhoX family phosphatase